MWVMSDLGRAQLLRQAQLASVAILRTAGLAMSSRCLMVGEPSVASSGYWLTQSLEFLLNGQVIAFGVANVALDQEILRDNLAREGFANCKNCSFSGSCHSTRWWKILVCFTVIGVELRHGCRKGK
ncbi:spermidine synthase, partial [Striga asiatica]